jgi:cytidylate kinase
VSIRLAEAMGLGVMRHEVLDHVADRMNVPKSLIGRLREGKAGFVERLTADQRSVALHTADELFALAARGDVVLRGWGATCLLRPVPHVVCVRITRSLERRVEWLMRKLETEDAAFAEAEVRRSDRAHAARMHELFDVTWGDPVLYDLVINTDRVSVDSAVEQIRALAARPEFAETEASRSLLADMALQARVRVALRDDATTRNIDVTIVAEAGRIALQGIVVTAEERVHAEQVASRVDGVAAVDNQLRLMGTSRRFTSAKHY